MPNSGTGFGGRKAPSLYENEKMTFFSSLQSVISLLLSAILLSGLTPSSPAQVHYLSNGSPWSRKAEAGPDAEVGGWYYNLGITGIRVQLMADAPRHLLVKYVFADSPAGGKIHPGDTLIGVNRQSFQTEHKNGYGMDKFGADGPILEFSIALESCQAKSEQGLLPITLVRQGKTKEVVLDVGQEYGAYAQSFPFDCPKTERIRHQLYQYLVDHQGEDGSWGIPPQDTFAPLALLASGEKPYLEAVKKNVQMHARTTRAEDDSWLINWRYMAAAIVMSEYHLATGEKWVLKELEEVYALLISSQYINMNQINEKVKETHPHAYPKDEIDSHGGWGHNPGFEGYGPISMLTAQGALAFALMHRCGIDVDPGRHQAAYNFLQRSAGANGYIWYKDQPSGENDWADMGRTGTSAIAHQLSPYQDGVYRQRGRLQAKVIGQHPQSFPDTHGSPIMGMGYTAVGANVVPGYFRQLMAANCWWFTLAQCHDGSFYYQPNRDNAGYGTDSRIAATAVTAFIFSIPKGNLYLTGKQASDHH